MIHQQTKQIYTFVKGRTLAIYYWGASPDVVAEYPTNHDEKKTPIIPMTFNFYIQTDYAIPINHNKSIPNIQLYPNVAFLHSHDFPNILIIFHTWDGLVLAELIGHPVQARAVVVQNRQPNMCLIQQTIPGIYIYIYNGNMIPTTMGKCWMDNDGIQPTRTVISLDFDGIWQSRTGRVRGIMRINHQ